MLMQMSRTHDSGQAKMPSRGQLSGGVDRNAAGKAAAVGKSGGCNMG